MGAVTGSAHPGGRAVAGRAAVAQAVLARAEERTGTRRQPWGSGTVVQQREVRSLPVDPALDGLLPRGLERGATVTVAGSTSLLLAMLAQASAEGAWVAVVGLPSVGLLAAHQTGLSLERLVLVPDAGPDGPRVLAALADGVDAVVAGDVALTDADRRRLSARARERSTVLVTTRPWPGASVVLTVESSRWSGVGRGEGLLRERVLTVSSDGRGAAGLRRRTEITLPVGAGGATHRAAVARVGEGRGTSLLGRRAG
ncbi:hypothetical protein Q6348_10015 [Isoptericola sp. b441]|uniref:Recombinase A n=1 Tax=Actinotalea lenta TaxID=3064654 RepID=A0ABT9DB57_9CELL|nr:hypothetical protein [Isoptericola sp. b441]MDO8107529.1 hypothetical protein [Isoptericola sp. b441]